MNGIFYLSQGKIYAYTDAGSICHSSEAVEKYRRNIREIYKRKEWKTSGQGAMFMGAATQEADEADIYAQVEAIYVADEETMLYAASMDNSCGLYIRDTAEPEALDRVVARKTDMRIFQLDYDAAHKQLIASVSDGPLERHLALCQVDSGDMRTITEGESVDIAPSFSRKNPATVYFSSAGIFFEPKKRTALFSSYSLNKLDLNSGDISEIASDAAYDFIRGRENAEGQLYCIRRRKHQNKAAGLNPLDIVLVPVRLLKAVFSWLNFFSQRYTGESLTKRTGGVNPAKQQQKTQQEIFIEDNLINVEKTLKENTDKGEKYPGIAPRSWELIRLSGDGGAEVVKRGVLDFTFGPDGDIIYSNGKYIIRLAADGTEEKLLPAHIATNISICDV